jgi:peptidoglycan/LPS O-acetylase OafA/YrhL
MSPTSGSLGPEPAADTPPAVPPTPAGAAVAPSGAMAGSNGLPAVPRARRKHEIDGLRALAVSLIVFHHSFMASLITSPRPKSVGSLLYAITTSGVELFFVLSGVLLLRPYFRGQRRFTSGPYLRRRIERLWPPYLVALAFAGFVMMAATAHPTWYSREVLPRFSVTGWLAQAGILNFGWTTYSGAWWSLTIEVLFYLSVPLVVFAVMGCDSRAKRVTAGVLLAVVSTLLIALAHPRSAAVADVAALFAPCFIMGGLLARYSPRRRTGGLLLGVGAAYVLFANWWPHADIHLGFGLFYAGLVIVATEPSSTVNHLLSKPLPVWLGERSYSLFLVHFPAFYLANWFASLLVPSRTASYFVLTRVTGLPLAMFLAMVTFWVVERRYARGLATADSFWPALHLST